LGRVQLAPGSQKENGSDSGGDRQEQGAKQEPKSPARRKRGKQEQRHSEHDNENGDPNERREFAPLDPGG
jgi:hypothetical protein